MPTFRTGTESQQNQIRLKNLLRGAEEKVLAAGLRPQEVKEFLEPALTLTTNVLFWRRQSDGLAVFRSRDLFRTFTLPEVFDEALTVAERFHVRPLLPLLQEDRRFYILALSQKELRLLEGTCQNVREIEIESVPRASPRRCSTTSLKSRSASAPARPAGAAWRWFPDTEGSPKTRRRTY
jgi:hypothetical protein